VNAADYMRSVVTKKVCIPWSTHSRWFAANPTLVIFPLLLTIITRSVIIVIMIRSFRDEDSQSLFMRESTRRWSLPVQRAGLRKLLILDAATSLNDLRLPPGNRLEKLSGERSGQYSIRVNDRWRVCFRWIQGDAIDVEIVDYH
jgi:toxin HigB-1